MRILDRVALILAAVGAINWGLVGAFRWNLVQAIFGGPDSTATRFVYIIVGLAGIYTLVYLVAMSHCHVHYAEDVTGRRDISGTTHQPTV